MSYDGPGFRLPVLLRVSEAAVDALTAAREEIDALNVYPVPDGDTGTNLLLTFQSAHEAVLRSVTAQGGAEHADLVGTVADYSRGLLLGARGNSGVIMSQLVGALLKRLAAAPPGEATAASLAEGMALATEASYAAVGVPMEGTILSVARAASERAAEVARSPHPRAGRVVRAAAAAAREALERTPEQLEVLRRAGVVDAGGRGLCVVLDAAESALTGKVPAAPAAIPRPLPAEPRDDLTAEGPSYEVIYLLDAPDDAVPTLRGALAALGDSLVVVGGDGLWNVHVHVDDVGAAVEAGITAGRPHRIRVTHFADQIAGRAGRGGVPPTRAGRAVVAVAYGEGLGDLFAAAGAAVVLASPSHRPSTGELLDAVRETGAAEVILLPNDRHVGPAARAAVGLAEEDGSIRVALVPTSTQVQGLAALAVHEPGRTLSDDLVEMTAAARHARSGAVTVAAERAITSAGPCEPGDVLGVVEGDFVVVGDDLFTVGVQVMERMLGGGGELFTVVAGEGAGDLAARCVGHLTTAHPLVQVVGYDGRQQRYPLLFGVE